MTLNDDAQLATRLVIEAVGLNETREMAVTLVRRLGIIGVFGVPDGYEPVPYRIDLAFRKLARIQYSVNTQGEPGLVSFAEALRRIAAGEVPLDHLRSDPWELEDLPDAVRAASEAGRGRCKVLVRVAGD